MFSSKLRGAYNKIVVDTGAANSVARSVPLAGNHAQGVTLVGCQNRLPGGDRDADHDASDQDSGGEEPRW